MAHVFTLFGKNAGFAFVCCDRHRRRFCVATERGFAFFGGMASAVPLFCYSFKEVEIMKRAIMLYSNSNHETVNIEKNKDVGFMITLTLL